MSFTPHWHRAVQASCGVFLLGGVRGVVQGPGQLVVDGSVRAEVLGQVNSRGLPTAAIQSFCNFQELPVPRGDYECHS